MPDAWRVDQNLVKINVSNQWIKVQIASLQILSVYFNPMLPNFSDLICFQSETKVNNLDNAKI
jgi:hypothetical protein